MQAYSNFAKLMRGVGILESVGLSGRETGGHGKSRFQSEGLRIPRKAQWLDHISQRGFLRMLARKRRFHKDYATALGASAIGQSGYCAFPTVSAMTAPRVPRDLLPSTVESRTVWCSISEFSCAPNKITMEEIHIHIIIPMPAPSEP